MSAGLELFGPICGTRAGTVAACAMAIELPDVSAPRMQSAPFEMSLRAALTPPSGVVASSAYSIWSLTSLTPARRNARLACWTASPADFAYAGPNTADAPVNGTTTPMRRVNPAWLRPLAVVAATVAASTATSDNAAASFVNRLMRTLLLRRRMRGARPHAGPGQTPCASDRACSSASRGNVQDLEPDFNICAIRLW